MTTGRRYYSIIAAVCILLTGCSGTHLAVPEPQPAGGLVQESPDQQTDPVLDHFVARVPYRLADTATKARAMTHIAIGRAKARTGSELCGGAWPVTGPSSGSTGPRLANAAGGPAWYYRVSHRPGVAGCGAASREALYESLEGTLPAWISLRRAVDTATDTGNITLYDAAR